ncbi:adenosine deaminase family protein [Actinoplanes sp. TBRC 11911]|nr:adenosine deaminase family protein [Actinoplanes sp. TBRC 11911]
MRPGTLAELAARAGLPLPAALPLRPAAAGVTHGWEVFQTLYDTARAVLRTAADITRVVTEAVSGDAAWVEIQVDPTSYAVRLGSVEAVVEAALAGGAGLILASSWAASPAVAVEMAHLAARYADRGVIGFGLSNDERLGRVEDFAPACRIAAEAGLRIVPHGGFYEGPAHVRRCVEVLGARRIGHGLTAAGDPAVVRLLADTGVALEICPASYPPLGVNTVAELPVRALLDAGVPVVLGSDDPLLFGVELTGQYELLRSDAGLTDSELATIARNSITASAAPSSLAATMLAGVDAWLAG